MEAVVSMRGVEKSYGAKVALAGFDLEIAPGRVVGLLGLNGAGKSTAMRLMTGLLKPDRGEIRVLGRDPWRMEAPDRRRIGYLSEKDFPFPELDLKAAVAFVSRFHPRWDDVYVAKLVEILDVPARTAYRALSRGQQRKFHLVLTLAPCPDLLLLDDPAQGLDVTVRRELIQSVLPLLEEGGSTVVFSSHVFSDVERLADTIAIVHEGRVLLVEELDALKERVVQIVVPARGELALRGTVGSRTSGGSTCVTLLDADPNAIAELRAKHPTLEERTLPLEEFFIELVESSHARRVS